MISIVIPLYNKERHIAWAIQSVLGQTYGDFELIVVDDGSKDEGAKVVESFTDPRVRLIHQENAGASAARNRGITEARAELIAFLDADDEWMPEHLETILRLVKNYPECGAYATAYEVVITQHRRRTPEFKDIPKSPWEGIIPNYFRSALGPLPVWTSAVAVWRRTFNQVGFFPVGVRRGEDLDMWCRIALKYRIAFSNYVTAVYFQDAMNRVCLTVADPLGDTDNALYMTLKHAIETSDYRKELSENELRVLFNSISVMYAKRNMVVGNKKKARDFLREISPINITILLYIALTLIPNSLLNSMINIKRIILNRNNSN